MKIVKVLNRRILCISDTHFPYQHRDTFKFLAAVQDRYEIDFAISVGDLNDNHYPSYHELEPGTYDGETELRKARECCQKLEQLFPQLIITEGNHDALPLRKAKTARIPEGHIRNYNEVFGVGQGWKWVKQAFLEVRRGEFVLVTHSVGANARTNASRFAHNSVQGHHHSEFGLHYYADNTSLRWHMGVGCLADPSSPAMNYASRAVFRRPILGVGVIIDGNPMLVPMVLNHNGRWTGRLP